MPRNDLFGRASRKAGHVLDVGTKRSTVDHRHIHIPAALDRRRPQGNCGVEQILFQ